MTVSPTARWEQQLVPVPAAEQQARASVDGVASLFQHAKRVVALTGAGISVESGIPPFRAPQNAVGKSGGIWGNEASDDNGCCCHFARVCVSR